MKYKDIDIRWGTDTQYSKHYLLFVWKSNWDAISEDEDKMCILTYIGHKLKISVKKRV